MRECDVAAEELLAYLDGCLDGEREAYVAHHVKVCPVCQIRQAELEETKQLLKVSTPLPNDEIERSQLKAEILRNPHPPLPRRRRRPLLMVVLAVLLSLILLWPADSSANLQLGRVVRGVVAQVEKSLLGRREPPGDRISGVLFRDSQAFVPPAELPLGLRLSDRATPGPRRVESHYRSESGVEILVVQGPADQGLALGWRDVELVYVGDTEVLWLKDPRPGNVAGMVWERHGILFELLVLNAPQGNEGGLPLEETLLIVRHIIAAHDAASSE